MVAMSGGVDSSVAALLLQQQGQAIAGLFMKNWEEDDRSGHCPAEQDAADAQGVAGSLGIPFQTRNFSAEYWDGVFENFITEYQAGRTPNPDILCNREIKFKTFLQHAQDLGAERIATGHYVRSDEVDGLYRLLRGRDHNKDQSYFLYTLGQDQLACADFPVGELAKSTVRQMANEAGFKVHNKKDSTGICFIGERDFRSFLSQYVDSAAGEMRTPEGQLIGQHQGLAFHTLGQRQGLGIGGVRGFPDAPWYVLHKDMQSNVLYVGQQHDHSWLLSQRVMATELSWASGQAPQAGQPLQAQVRYRQPAQTCRVVEVDESSLVVEFDLPQWAVTPGQSMVLYDGKVCLGGGIIQYSNTPPAEYFATT
ncbi:MAG: tRNA 2-thiouridine(34) synthase MnmA [Xanthomonadales bacterium]|nr:tRNA 2-thiouridine(34) synthase MnmA [Xanthomonadales bacterium]